ncbi:MAG: hypothetical protein RhofKO_39560 [Rhodothermales bacterium]
MRYLDDLTPVDRYLSLKAKRAEIDAELGELKPLLTTALMEEDGEVFGYHGHRFTIQRRKRYAYSERVDDLTRTLKAIKKQEERNGTAELVAASAYPVVTKS